MYLPKCDNSLPCKFYKKAWMSGQAGKCLGPDFNYCVNDFRENSTTFSHTAKQLFVECRYAFYLKYILGIQPREDQLSDPLLAGQLWDDFIGNYHNGKVAVVWPDTISEQLKAKLSALMKVHLQYVSPTGEKFKAQEWIRLKIDGVQIAGAVDRAYADYFVETKLSTRPDSYLKPHNMTSQLGTYFLANPKWKYAIMEVTRMPGQYFKNDETPDDYYKKVYQDIVKRPSYYFQGLNREQKKFGVRIDRNDINLDRVEREYKMVIQEMRNCLRTNAYYHQYSSCHDPFECPYIPICDTDTVSQTLYTVGGKFTPAPLLENKEEAK